MPELTTFNWMIICLGFSCVTGIAVFFLKNLFTKHEKHNDDISDIQKEYAPRAELNNATNALRYDHRSVKDRIAEIERAVTIIRETFATKIELKELRAELRDESKNLAKDVADIKTNYLTKDEFQQTMFTINRSIEKMSEENIKKNDKMLDILMELKGEVASAKK